MSQLRVILDRFNDTSKPISLQQLAREMGLPLPMLTDMLDYWVRKGKLREVSRPETCHTCGVKTGCPFVMALPRLYERVPEPRDCESSAPPCACDTGKCGCG
jgi:hypothetical protein